MFPSDTSHHAHLDRSRPGCWRGAWLLVLFFVGALACAQVMPLSEAYRDAAAARMPEARTLVDQVLADAAAVNRPVYDLLSAEETAAVGTSTGAVQQEAETLNAALSALRIGELNTMSDDLSHISPVLRRYMPGTSMFNMSGQPSMSMPLAWNAAGLPLGMMFTARFGDEATLFRLAAQLEQARPWKDRTPPVSA